jgi:hypothetical protein
MGMPLSPTRHVESARIEAAIKAFGDTADRGLSISDRAVAHVQKSNSEKIGTRS